MGVSVICFEIKGARGPNITQVVKPVSKYKKQASSAFQLPLRRETIKRLIGVSSAGVRPLIVDPGGPSRGPPVRCTRPKKNATARVGALIRVPPESAALPC